MNSLRKLQIALLLLLLPNLAFAAGGTPDASTLVIYWTTFLVFIALFVFITRKPLVMVWKKRCSSIEEAVLKGEKELEAANDKKQAAQELYKTAAAEVKKITESISKESVLEAEKILKEADAQAERIIAQAEQNSESELNSMTRNLQEEFAEKVYQAARTKLQAEFNVDFDKEYRKSSIAGVKGLVKNV